MRIHISAICGTFMGGIAQLAKQKGMAVSGSDKNCYPPMSTQLEQAGIQLLEGFAAEHLTPAPDCVVVGNAMSRGNPEVEYILERGLNYRSGPQWLAENILLDKWVIAVAGTHGKTTTASMVAWILEYADLNPGFLIGGVPQNFSVSARLTDSIFFVVEADEYDTAFFDKRSKFVHYRARTTILNNLEFDHADIFEELAAIETQFHHLVRTIPNNGLVIHPAQSEALDRVLEQGCWTPQQSFGEQGDWSYQLIEPDGSHFEVYFRGQSVGRVQWPMIGMHNVNNAIAAIAAAHHAGVLADVAVDAINQFKGVKRRMELKGEVNQIRVYDDFAHHPTAIQLTVQGLRRKVGKQQIIAVVDIRSNTMRMGHHKQSLSGALKDSDVAILHDPQSIDWSTDGESIDKKREHEASADDNLAEYQLFVLDQVDSIIDKIVSTANPGSHVLLMSNGAFGGIYDKLLAALSNQSVANNNFAVE